MSVLAEDTECRHPTFPSGKKFLPRIAFLREQKLKGLSWTTAHFRLTCPPPVPQAIVITLIIDIVFLVFVLLRNFDM